MSCRCIPPRAGKHPDWCGACGKHIDARPWDLDEPRARAFYAEVREALAAADVLGGGEVERLASDRFFKLGPTSYRHHEYLLRDNPLAGREEASDALNYAMMEDARLHLEQLAEPDDIHLRARLRRAAHLAALLDLEFRGYAADLRAARGHAWP